MIPERLLLGPGPSPVCARVMQALSRPALSHLDPMMIELLDAIRSRLGRVFLADANALSIAISGTGTAGMEAAVANTVSQGASAAVIVNGYFGDRLARMFELYGANVTRLAGEWGRAFDPAVLDRLLAHTRHDIVAVVHAETSTGVLNPLQDILAIARAAGAVTVVDAVTSFAAMPLRASEWGVDVCYSCTQKGLGAPSGLAPVTFSPRVRERKNAARSFYLDLTLLEDYWLRRKYHHTISAPLIYALHEALVVVEDEGLERRWERHKRNHLALAAGLDSLGLELLPPPGERLWTLNAVRIPDGVDDGSVRRRLLGEFNIEIGAGLGPLAGRVWRVGLMGSGSSLANVLLFLSALERTLTESGYHCPQRSAALIAAEAAAQG
jgi:alanine-glyoxylate transaminase/serine-glyoxylate transaminase/serine-pyruvate transaminase